MIIVPWWVLPILVFAGIGLSAFMATIWRAHLDAVAEARADAILQALTVAAESGLPPAVDPWSPERFFDGLREPAPPVLPEHPWLKDPTGPLVVAPVDPEAAAVVASVVGDDEPPPNPRKRFEEMHAPPWQITVAADVDGEVRLEPVSVKP